MPYTPRKLVKVKRQLIRLRKDSPPKWEVVQYFFSDGGEVFEVRTLDGEFPTKRFRLRSEVDEWLRKHGMRQ